MHRSEERRVGKEDQQHEYGEQSSCEEEEVLRLEPFELHAAPDALIDRVLHGGYAYRKNERSTVALTIRKMHAPNQLAAVLLVSGSPDENLL